ncbi:hypothetical protein CC80DRAFT_542908 [Byssothecium circinans]|uniref:Zn(2)-C6 fungal-type domain-containing protein n=1 Tax=Byssothecium circinans TaxID=147558 RepID=A0A6A5UCH7_9PLEO|nr:hypothetical protein CC80DRAFT_542908 [Byssothecium circinans]
MSGPTPNRDLMCVLRARKGFARVDLLKRHAENHTSDRTNKRQRTEIVRKSRVVQACEACSQHHLRCEDDKPCSRCRQKKIVCRLPDSNQNEIHAAQDLLNLSNDLHRSAQQSNSHSQDSTSIQSPNPSTGQETGTATQAQEQLPTHGIDPTLLNEAAPPVQSSYVDDAIVAFDDSSPIDPLLPDYVRNMQPLNTSLSGFATPREPKDLSFNWDMDFNSFDFSVLDQYSFHENLHGILSTDQAATQHHAQNQDEDGAAARAEAFEGSVWRYMPLRNLNPVIAEQPNIAIVDGEEGHQTRSRRVISERLSTTSRDKLLALVLAESDPSNVKSISSRFPSLELLDSIIQIFLAAPSIDAGSYFHLPTFSPSKLYPELRAGIVAAGALAMPDVTLHKLGLAFQEASRVAITKAFDNDNTAIRDIQFLQIQFILVEIGMWSGISRKMEIEESFLPPPVTMLRRGGRFRRSTWKTVIPTSDDYGAVLQRKWMEWVHKESWLRLVYRYFECDRHSSMALLKPPLIPHSEMQLPLPHADNLWYAPSASMWKAAYLASSTPITKRPTPYDCVHDLGHLAYQGPANKTFLYMTWGMIWEYRQLAALSSKFSSNSSLLSLQYQELTKYCEDFRVSSFASDRHVDTLLEVMLMHLDASLHDIQTFAGIAGPEEAKHAYPTLLSGYGHRDSVSLNEEQQYTIQYRTGRIAAR